MNLQAEFKALIDPLVSGGAWANVAPDMPVKPYITYSRVVAVVGSTLDANGGTDNETNTQIQIDIWSMAYSEAQAKATAVKSALKGWAIVNTVTGEQDGYEPDTKLHRVMLTVSAWH